MQAQTHLHRREDALHAFPSTLEVLACKTSCLLVIVGAGKSHRLDDDVHVPVYRKRDDDIILGRLALARHLALSMPLQADREHLQMGGSKQPSSIPRLGLPLRSSSSMLRSGMTVRRPSLSPLEQKTRRAT